jgi:hypothetical protein
VSVATYATVDDVRDEYEGTIPVERNDYVEQKLVAAERILSAPHNAGDLAELIASGQATAEDVRFVLCNMVLRLIRNPTGIRTQSAGPYSVTLDRQHAHAGLIVTKEDKKLLGLSTGAMTLHLVDDTLSRVVRKPRYDFPL